MTRLWALSAHEVALGVRRGDFSAVEVAADVLDRIKQVNSRLNALVQLDEEWTLSQAHEVDVRNSQKKHLPLAGVPISIKDNIWVKGKTITQGSLLFKDFVAPEDAWSVMRLQELGAVLIGISNCSEFACKGVSNNLVYGQTRSPWNIDLTPGGSSGGAVSAVASGMGALALVTDAGGSTRRPAAHCGLVGMKPTFGLIPCGPGFDEPNFGLSVMGQVGRNVKDVGLMLSSLVQFSHRDWGSQAHDLASGEFQLDTPPPQTLRIAYSPDLGCEFAVDHDVQSKLAKIIDSLRLQGYNIKEASPQWPSGVREYPLLKLQQAGLASLYGKVFEQTPELLDQDIAAQIQLGLQHSAIDIASVMLLREHIYAAYAAFFQNFDILLCPTTPTVSWPVSMLGPSEIGGKPAGPRGHAVFTPLFNYCQAPACSVPAGLVRELPVGLQIVGRRYEDLRVLQMASWIQKTVGPFVGPSMWNEGIEE